jgi:hypothetical protein
MSSGIMTNRRSPGRPIMQTPLKKNLNPDRKSFMGSGLQVCIYPGYLHIAVKTRLKKLFLFLVLDKVCSEVTPNASETFDNIFLKEGFLEISIVYQ